MKIRDQIIIFLIALVIVVPLASYMTIKDSNFAKNLEISGVVEGIEWNPPLNHELPIYHVRLETGEVNKISHWKIRLSKNNIAVGDKIFKKRGSIYCLINDVIVQCAAPGFNLDLFLFDLGVGVGVGVGVKERSK